MSEIEMLSVINGKSLLELDVDPPKFIISRFMPTGLHMLAGSPKIGKSWLALWLCNQISKGEKVWEFDTFKCGALYLSLEDTIDRLHFRLSSITETGSEQSYFTTNADNLSRTFIKQLEAFMTENSDIGLIVIDTFQRIRETSNDKNSYGNDYEEINKIKVFADQYKIAVLLVHHLRKMPDSDPFNMVSGSTGIIGAVDSIYVLEKDKRTDSKAKLHITGRDIADMQLLLEFDRDNAVWNFVSYLTGEEKTKDKNLDALIGFFKANKIYDGTMSGLLEKVQAVDNSFNLQSNGLSRLINNNLNSLQACGITVNFKKVKGVKLIRVSMVDENTCMR